MDTFKCYALKLGVMYIILHVCNMYNSLVPRLSVLQRYMYIKTV